MEHSQGSWTDTALAYPKPGDCGGSGSPGALPEPSCASPTNCVNHRSVHVTICKDAEGTTSSSGAGGGGGEATSSGAGGSEATATDATSGAGVGGGAVTSGSGSGGSGGVGNGEEDGTLHGSCSCRMGEVEESPGGGGVMLVAALGVITVRRSRRRR
jgi:MYXO-CTERM domain-containing protein